MPPFRKNKEAQEIEREVRFRQGLHRVRGYIEQCRQSQKRLWELGKRSLQLEDRRQFENVARAYLRLAQIISRWERYMVAAETVAIQRGQVKATREFLGSMNALSESMLGGVKTEEVMAMQRDLEKAMVRARALDERLAVVMDAAGETIFSDEGLSADTLQDVEKVMAADMAAEGRITETDHRIAEGAKKIEEEMRRV